MQRHFKSTPHSKKKLKLKKISLHKQPKKVKHTLKQDAKYRLQTDTYKYILEI